MGERLATRVLDTMTLHASWRTSRTADSGNPHGAERKCRGVDVALPGGGGYDRHVFDGEVGAGILKIICGIEMSTFAFMKFEDRTEE